MPVAELNALGITGLTPGAIGIWTLVALVIIALVKAWPVLAKQAADAKAQLRKERRDDLSDCQQRLDAMGVRVDNLVNDLSNLRIELAATLSAYRILEVEVEAHNPASLGLAEARAILSAAFTIAPAPVLKGKNGS